MSLTLFCPEKPKFILDFVEFACEYLQLYKLEEKEVTVLVQRRLESNCFGECYGDEDFATVSIARKVLYCGTEMPISRHELLLTIAHELTHAKQYLKGELSDLTEKEASLWKGKQVKWPTSIASSAGDDLLPWEKEAYEIEEKIYEQYQKYGKSRPRS